jgi:hypothetical protein
MDRFERRKKASANRSDVDETRIIEAETSQGLANPSSRWVKTIQVPCENATKFYFVPQN